MGPAKPTAVQRESCLWLSPLDAECPRITLSATSSPWSDGAAWTAEPTALPSPRVLCARWLSSGRERWARRSPRQTSKTACPWSSSTPMKMPAPRRRRKSPRNWPQRPAQATGKSLRRSPGCSVAPRTPRRWPHATWSWNRLRRRHPPSTRSTPAWSRTWPPRQRWRPIPRPFRSPAWPPGFPRKAVSAGCTSSIRCGADPWWRSSGGPIPATKRSPPPWPTPGPSARCRSR